MTDRCQDQCLAACKALLAYADRAGTSTSAANSAETNPLALFGGINLLNASSNGGGGEGSQVKAPIALEISYLRAPDPCRVPVAIRLPNELHSDSHVCVIVADPGEDKREQLEEDRVANVSRVMDTTELNGRFSDPVARRALAKSFDAFFVHSKLTKYPALLTGEFLDHQTPIWMSRKGKTFADQIRETNYHTVCANRGFDNVSVHVGFSHWDATKLAENVLAAAETVVNACQGKWNDIAALRVASALPDTTTTAEKSNGKKNKQQQNALLRLSLPFFAHQYPETHGDLFEAAAAKATAKQSPAAKPAPKGKKGGAVAPTTGAPAKKRAKR